MEREKMIEEMANDIPAEMKEPYQGSNLTVLYSYQRRKQIAKCLVSKNYRKVHEGEIVVNKKQIADLALENGVLKKMNNEHAEMTAKIIEASQQAIEESKEQASKETEKESFNINQMNGNLVLENQQLKDRITELEDKIENGTLIELPCKVGDTLYFLQYYCDSRGCSRDTQSYCCGCKEMITRERNNAKYIIATKNCKWSDIPTIGEKYFVTRSEAKAKLKELKEKQK